MTAVLTATEIESIRFHLDYGNISVGGYPYTPDGYFELFTNVVAEYLTTGAETTATTAVVADTIVTITPASMTGITANARLVIDVDTDQEIVVVKSVTVSTFTARFAKAHTGTYPIAVDSGVARVRRLLALAEAAYAKLTGDDTSASIGVKQVDEVHFFGGEKNSGMSVLEGKKAHYDAIVAKLASLICVPVNCLENTCGGGTQLETY
jgi:hypothetical protein